MSNKAQQFCLNCGGVLTGIDSEWLTCEYCDSKFENQSFQRRLQNMQELLNEINLEYVNNQRRNLYDAIHAKYISTTEVRQYATEIKKHLPNDFQANFYLQATSEDVKEINAAIRGINVDANYDSLPPIIHFLISSLQTEYLLELNNLVERAYKKRDLKLFSHYATQISEEAEKVSEGVYATNIPRDVFIAYSSKDMEQVSALCEELESQGISCFIAARNLRHGVGAVENYDAALKDAMDNCRCFVFVSSKNSRTLSCDAVTKEIPYIRSCDIANAPAHLRNNYEAIPEAYKKPRVEYRIGNAKATDAASRITDAFFEGHEWTYTPEAVAVRIVQLLYEKPVPAPVIPEPTPVVEKESTPQGTPSPAAVEKKPATKKKTKAPVVVAITLLLVGAIAAGAWAVPKLANNPAEETGEETESDDSSNQNQGQQNQGQQNQGQQNQDNNSESSTVDPEETQQNSDIETDIPEFVIDENASQGLTFTSAGSGTCYVSGIGSCTDADIIIPAISPDGERVIGIKERAFDHTSKITSVTIPDGVTMIGSYAFEMCSQLTSVVIPDSVKTIGNSAFSNCSKLTSVTIPKGVTSIEYSTFSSCSALTSITIPEGVTAIGSGAFSGCRAIQTLNIPKGVLSIAANAFNGCSGLLSVSIPKSTILIDEKAFSSCTSMLSFTVDPDNERYDDNGNCLIDKTTKTLIIGFKTSTIPNDGSITNIGANAFNGVSGLQAISIPEGVINIGDYAFNNCGCSGNLTIPASVQHIGQEAFRKNHFSLITVDAKNTVYRSSGNCLIDTATKRLILGADVKNGVVIPSDGSVTSIDTYAFEASKNLASILIPNGVTHIEDSAFTSSTQLQEVHMADSVTHIGENAFASCTQLQNVTFSGGLINIGKAAFKSCSSLLEAHLPSKVEHISEDAFYGCNKMTSLILPDSVESIEARAFYGCNKLTSLTLPGKLQSIEKNSFHGLSSLASITVDSSNTKYRSNGNCLIEIATKTLILGCSNSTIPTDGSVTRIGDSAFSGCSSLTSITIPKGITYIGSSAFSGCNGLTWISIPEGVTEIGSNAFNSSSSAAKTVFIPVSLKSLGREAFGYMSKVALHYAGTESQWNALLDASEFSMNSRFTIEYESTN